MLVKKEQRGVMATQTAAAAGAKTFTAEEKNRLLHRRHAKRRNLRDLPIGLNLSSNFALALSSIHVILTRNVMNFSTIAARKEFSEEKLIKFTSNLQAKLNGHTGLDKRFCVYATGSYSRGEAHTDSDLDLFLLDCEKNDMPLPNIDQILIKAKIIEAAREQNLPEFSNDGQYLSVQSFPSLLNELGAPNDVTGNHFTARMLLLLESKVVYGENAYDFCLEKVIAAYYRDYPQHSADFKPVFLANDIIRYWKTLCLSYEHRRNRPINDLEKRNKAHIVNLKLKVSRLCTCYSMLISLLARPDPCGVDEVLTIAKKTPIERLEDLWHGNKEFNCLGEALTIYDWFLGLFNDGNAELVGRIAKKEERREMFNRASEFGDLIFQAMMACFSKQPELKRFLFV